MITIGQKVIMPQDAFHPQHLIVLCVQKDHTLVIQLNSIVVKDEARHQVFYHRHLLVMLVGVVIEPINLCNHHRQVGIDRLQDMIQAISLHYPRHA